MSPVVHDNTALTERLADNLRVALMRRSISGRELARRLGVSHTWVNVRATGAVSPTLDDVSAMADALDMSPAELLGFGQPVLVNPEAQDVDEVLSEKRLPRPARDAVLSLVGQAVALAYMSIPKRRALPPAEPQMTTKKARARDGQR